MLREFRRRLWQPPRAHGDVIPDRSVSFLELFHDLVYVVLIAGAADTLAHDISWRTLREFAVIFGLIFLAWINATILHDVHGRDDVRTRSYVFVQMLLTALLAVFVGDAAGGEGSAFAWTYGVLMLLLTWSWYSVRRQDAEEFMEVTRRYMWLMAVTTVLMFGSIGLSDDLRIGSWAAFVVTWLVVAIVIERSEARASRQGVVVSDSLVERFGLFTIIVLGEVLVGVVGGLTDAERDVETLATGLIALVIGFGLWWTYFDIVARRPPRDDGSAFPLWIVVHLPLTMSIAAAGAAMVSLVQHAGDERAPIAASWLITGAVAVGLLTLIVILQTLQHVDHMRSVYASVSTAMAVGAVASMTVGLWRPAPIVLVSALALIQSLVWGFAVSRWLQAEPLGAPQTEG